MKWDNVYSDEGYTFGTTPNDFLLENYKKLKPGKVLCIAEGEGRNAVFLALQGFEVTAMDASSVGLNKALAFAAENNVEITTIHADLNDFDFGVGCWDNIVSIFCHLPPELRDKVHSNIKQSLVAEGVLLLEAYTAKQLGFATGGPKQVDRMMSQSQLERDFEGMNFVHSIELERDVAEGERHKGPSAVVQMIAIK